MRPARKFYTWACQKVHSPWAALWLGCIFLMEILLFVPLDLVLMLFCLEKREKRMFFATLSTLASLLSGIIGYLIGWLLWDTIGPYLVGYVVSEDFFNRLSLHYAQYESLAVLAGALLPIPFKVLVLSAGFCQVPFLPFVLCILIARAARFFLLAQAMYLWGEKISSFIDRYFNRIVMAVGAKIALTFTFFWALGR